MFNVKVSPFWFQLLLVILPYLVTFAICYSLYLLELESYDIYLENRHYMHQQ